MKASRVYLFLAVFIGFCRCGMGQDLNYVHYTVDQGLPSSQVHDIIQDKYGNLWFTTDHGLARYNGYTFTNYTTNDGLTDNVVFKFFKQPNGDIWCTTFNKSTFYIKGRKPVFIPYKFNAVLTSLPDFQIANCLHIGKNGDLFMGIINGIGYIHIDPNGNLINTVYKPTIINKTEIGLATTKGRTDFFYIHSVTDSTTAIKKYFDRVSGSAQYNRFDEIIKACYFTDVQKSVFTKPKGIKIIKPNGDSIVISTKNEPISMGKFDKEHFWVGFRYGGIQVYDLKGTLENHFLHGKSVTSLYIDHEGGYWFSTLNDGVFHTKSIYIKTVGYLEPNSSWINSMTQDENGNIVLGFYNGDVGKLTNGKFEILNEATILKPALTAFNRHTRKAYYFTDRKLFSTSSSTPIANVDIPVLNFQSIKDNLFWFAGYSGVGVMQDKKLLVTLLNKRINDLCYFGNKLCLATNQGLYYLKGQTSELLSKNKLLANARIIDVDAWNDKIIMATKGMGVLINFKNKVVSINTHNGLSDDIVGEIYIENDTVAWACTNSGLNRLIVVNNRVKSVKVITNHDGLISNEVTDIEVKHDTVWVGTRQGLCYFPKSILKEEDKLTNYYIEINSVKVNDQEVRPKSLTKLRYFENRIEFGFKGVTFFEYKPIIYRYKLKGLEKKWNYTKSLSVMYSTLPPGKYTFILQARANTQSWSRGQQTFSFTIRPPFWRTWWFFFALMFTIGLLIYLFFRYRILTYNRDITRELLRQLLKRLKRKTNHVVFREQGKDIRIPSLSINYVKADGNYIEIHTDKKKYVIRYKIGEFLGMVPDPLEYLRISRSYIIRLDKVQEKSKKDVTVAGEKITVGETYLDELEKIKF